MYTMHKLIHFTCTCTPTTWYTHMVFLLPVFYVDCQSTHFYSLYTLIHQPTNLSHTGHGCTLWPLVHTCSSWGLPIYTLTLKLIHLHTHTLTSGTHTWCSSSRPCVPYTLGNTNPHTFIHLQCSPHTLIHQNSAHYNHWYIHIVFLLYVFWGLPVCSPIHKLIHSNTLTV